MALVDFIGANPSVVGLALRSYVTPEARASELAKRREVQKFLTQCKGPRDSAGSSK